MAVTAEQNSKSTFVPICITQAVCIVVILIAMLVIKFQFTGSWQKIRKFCIDNVLEQTKITAQFNEDVNT